MTTENKKPTGYVSAEFPYESGIQLLLDIDLLADKFNGKNLGSGTMIGSGVRDADYYMFPTEEDTKGFAAALSDTLTNTCGEGTFKVNYEWPDPAWEDYA